MKVLITSGATRESIDSVRFITNFSSGVTGARIADQIISGGAEVFFLKGIQTEKPIKFCEVIEFSDCKNLESKMKSLLSSQKFDAVIHLAAVSDYFVSEVKVGDTLYPAPLTLKIDSGESLELVLRKNLKILPEIRGMSLNPDMKLIGFKLTSKIDKKEILASVKNQFELAHVDWVVHNTVDDLLEGRRHFEVFDSKGTLGNVDGIESLGQKLNSLLRGR